MTTTHKIAPQGVRVSTGQYRASHGKLPRGSGYWGFSMGCARGYHEVWGTGMYSAIAKDARIEAASRGLRTVSTLS